MSFRIIFLLLCVAGYRSADSVHFCTPKERAGSHHEACE